LSSFGFFVKETHHTEQNTQNAPNHTTWISTLMLPFLSFFLFSFLLTIIPILQKIIHCINISFKQLSTRSNMTDKMRGGGQEYYSRGSYGVSPQLG
jgi:hypothetical protein